MSIRKFLIDIASRILLLGLLPCSLYAETIDTNDVKPQNAALNITHQILVEGAIQYVERVLEKEIASGLKITASQLDSRIPLPSCNTQIKYDASTQALAQSNITVKAYCPSSSWYQYLMVQAQLVQHVVVSSIPLSAGTILSPANIKLVELDQKRLHGSTYASLEQLVGARVKRHLRPDQPITPAMLCFVCKGDSVTIIASTGGLSIKTRGIAEQDGNLGEQIWVKNRQSSKLVNAKVSDIDVVHVSI